MPKTLPQLIAAWSKLKHDAPGLVKKSSIAHDPQLLKDCLAIFAALQKDFDRDLNPNLKKLANSKETKDKLKFLRLVRQVSAQYHQRALAKKGGMTDVSMKTIIDKHISALKEISQYCDGQFESMSIAG